MNLLFAKIRWNRDIADPTEQDNKFFNNVLDFYATRSNNFVFDAEPFYYNKNRHVFCSVIGYISNLEEIKSKYSICDNRDVRIIEELYSLKKLDFIPELDGLFFSLIFDKRSQEAYIFQSEAGFNLPIYYTYDDNEFILSTSLKQVLKNTRSKKELDIDATKSFLICRYIVPSESTLVKNVKKLLYSKYIAIDYICHSVNIYSLPSDRKNISISEADRNLLKPISDNISGLFNQLNSQDCLTIALSGGSDSNFLLYYLRNLTKQSINAITLNRGDYRNEVSEAKAIIENYTNVKHITGKVETDLDSLPDIVWRFEGYVYHPFDGVFYVYNIARALHKLKCSYVFMGLYSNEIADLGTENYVPLFSRIGVILNNISLEDFKYSELKSLVIRAYTTMKRKFSHKTIKTAKQKEMVSKLTVPPIKCMKLENKEIHVDYVGKLFEIMLNDFGIQGLYPYRNKKTIKMSKILGPLLDHNRRLFIKKIKKIMPSRITKLFKSGGSTCDLRPLLDRHKDLLMKVLRSQFVNTLLTKDEVEEIIRYSELNHQLILHLVYVYLFNELFISGKFDARFDEHHLDIPLEEFINKKVCGV